MKKYENIGFTSILTADKLKIEIPISALINSFNYCPNNSTELTVKRGKRQVFSEFCAKNIIEECDPETGGTYISEAFDKMFELIFEGYEDSREFIHDPEEDED